MEKNTETKTETKKIMRICVAIKMRVIKKFVSFFVFLWIAADFLHFGYCEFFVRLFMLFWFVRQTTTIVICFLKKKLQLVKWGCFKDFTILFVF